MMKKNLKKPKKISMIALGLATSTIATFAATAIILYFYKFGDYILSEDPNDWGVFGDFIAGVMNPLIALINIAVVVFIAFEVSRLESQREEDAANAEYYHRMAAEERERKNRAISLHEYFLSPGFYSNVRSPAYQVSLSWSHLQNDLKESYRNVVIQGWAFSSAEKKIDFYVGDPPNDINLMAKYHFQSPRALTSLTEHQALTSLLRFWTRLRILLDENLIDHRVTAALFRDQFFYEVTFFNELSKGVSEKLKDGMVFPRWINDVEFLEEFFIVNSAAHNDLGP